VYASDVWEVLPEERRHAYNVVHKRNAMRTVGNRYCNSKRLKKKKNQDDTILKEISLESDMRGLSRGCPPVRHWSASKPDPYSMSHTPHPSNIQTRTFSPPLLKKGYPLQLQCMKCAATIIAIIRNPSLQDAGRAYRKRR
jgi:hypothetical protein